MRGKLLKSCWICQLEMLQANCFQIVATEMLQYNSCILSEQVYLFRILMTHRSLAFVLWYNLWAFLKILKVLKIVKFWMFER